MSCGPESAGFSPIALVLWVLDLHLFPLIFFFLNYKKWEMEAGVGKYSEPNTRVITHQSMQWVDRPSCSLCILQFLYEMNMEIVEVWNSWSLARTVASA